MTKSTAKSLALLLFLGMTVLCAAVSTTSWMQTSSQSSPLQLVRGTYSATLSISSSSNFTSGLSVVSNDTRFTFRQGYSLPEGQAAASDQLGCAGDVTPNTYTVHFSVSDTTNWSGPGDAWIQVVDTPIELDVAPLINYSMHNCYPYAVIGAYFNLSQYAPYSDITITPNPPAGDNNFTAIPPFLKLSKTNPSGGFTYHCSQDTQYNTMTKFTFTITGTNAASYVIKGDQIVNAVPSPNPNSVNQTVNGTFPMYTSLSSTAANLTIVAGTFSLPMTLSTPRVNFQNVVWITANNFGFAFNPLMITTTDSNTHDSFLGASTGTKPGTYNLSFTSNATTTPNGADYLAPANVVVQVVNTPIQLSVGEPVINVTYQQGVSTSSLPIEFDLTAYAPWGDLTIIPTLPDGDNNWTVDPISITLTKNQTKASFVFKTKTTAVLNSQTPVTYKLVGTNAASYTISGTQIVNTVNGASTGSDSGDGSTGTGSGSDGGSGSGSGSVISTPGSGTGTGVIVSSAGALMTSIAATFLAVSLIL